MKRMLSTFLVMVILITLAACVSSEKTSAIPPEEYTTLCDKYLSYANIFSYTWNDATDLTPETILGYCASYYLNSDDDPIEFNGMRSTLIPQNVVEPMIQRHFDVSTDFLRSGRDYLPEHEVYDMYAFADSTYVQVTSAERNGTLLTICYDLIHPPSPNPLRAQGTVIIDVKDEDYKYITNSVTAPVKEAAVETIAEASSVSLPSDELDFMEQLKNGDFSNVSDMSDYQSEYMERVRDGLEDYEWVECELNGNGLRGLIWREKYSRTSGDNRITAVFAVTDEEARLIWWDGLGSRDMHHFLGKNGNIIHAYLNYGTETNSRYTHYIVNNDWLFEEQEVLMAIRTYDWAIDELKEDGLYDWWLEDHPYWAEAGIYYFRQTDGVEEAVDEQQFLKAFEEMTGYSFYGDNPMKPD